VIFLIEYNRRLGKVVRFDAFSDSEQERAQSRRLELELKLNRRRLDHEVVLLQAATEEALRRTHRRYFENPREIVRSTGE